MKVKQPEPFTFEAGERALLLLHGFTGHTADVRMLGRFLQRHHYTSHAPILRGHGQTPEQLLNVKPDEWWEDVLAGYNHLKSLGYEQIAVAGLSLGGVLGLKLAYSKKVTAVISMCAPMYFDNDQQLTTGFKLFAKQYKQLERKDEQTIQQEITKMLHNTPHLFQDMGPYIESVRQQIDFIYTPTMVVQARHDEMINPHSANVIFENVQSETKQLNWYEKSGHVITLDKERDQLHEDILTFLQLINWAN